MRLKADQFPSRMCQISLLGFTAAIFILETSCGGASSKTEVVTPPPPPPCQAVSAFSAAPRATKPQQPGPAGSVPLTFFAVNDTTPTDPPQLNYGTLGHPVPLAWQTIQAGGSTSFDFSMFDGFASIAPQDSNGVAQMVMTLGMTPPWATSDASTCRTGSGVDTATTGCTAPPTNISDWTNFIQQLINHYNGVTAPHIKYYEIWNEADPDSDYWTGTAQQLEQLAAAAYPILKTDPNSLVVTPSMAGNVHSTGQDATIPFLTAFLQAGGNPFPYADAASFHGFVYGFNTTAPYPLPTEDCSGNDPDCGGAINVQVSTYRQTLDQNGMSGAPLLNTEGGFEDASITDPSTAAAWLAQYYALQAAMYNGSNIQLVSWFTWGATDGQLESNNQLTPVGIAYNQVSNWLVNNTMTAPCAPTGNIWTCAVTGSNGYQAEIIWDSSQTCTCGVCTNSNQSVGSVYTSYLDLSGNSTPISGGSVQVGLQPILLQNQNP